MLFRSRYLWKLYAGYAFLILLTLGLVSALVTPRIESDTLVDIDRRLKEEAILLREIAGAELTDNNADPELLQSRIRTLGQEASTRFTVIRSDGTVIADSAEEPSRMGNHSDRPELIQAESAGLGTSSRFSQTVRRPLRYLALPVERYDNVVGFVRTALPLDEISSRLWQLRLRIAIGGGAAALVALILGFVLARRFTRPLLSMTSAAESIAGGDYGSLVPMGSDDELGTLALAFNSMSQRLQDTSATVRSEHSKLSAILGSMAEGLVAVDGEERVVHMNAVAGHLLEADPKAAAGRPIWELTRITHVSEALTEAIQSGEAVHRLVRLPGAGERVIELHASPMRQLEGALGGAVLLFDDVTQLKRLETMRQDFVGNVSHELKTPVTVIRGLLETIHDDPEMPGPTLRRFLDKIFNQTLRLSSIVTDLLSLSRLESEAQALELEILDLATPVQTAITALTASAENRGVRLEAQLEEPSPLVEAEHEMVREAVGNLLDNAVKYSPAGSAVEVRLYREGEQAIVAVHDDGPGIEPRFQERIFERFFRVDKARSRELGGTGLGLAIVKHTALRLGGRVSLESRLGRGSTFRIHLPAIDDN